MDTDRLLSPTKDVQKAIDNLWKIIHRAGDLLAVKQDNDAEIHTRIAYLESEIESKNNAQAALSATIEGWKEEISTIDELRASLKALYEKLNDMQSIVSQKEDLIAELSSRHIDFDHKSLEVELLNAQLNDLQENLARLLKENEVLLVEVEIASAKEAEIESLRVREKQLSFELSIRDKSAEESTRTISDLQEQIQQFSLKFESDKIDSSAMQGLEVENISLRQTLEKTQAQLVQQHNSSDEYKSQLHEITERMYESEKQRQSAEEKLRIHELAIRKPSGMPTLIEGALLSEIENYKLKILELETIVKNGASAAGESMENSDETNNQDSKSGLHLLAKSLRQTADQLTQELGTVGVSDSPAARAKNSNEGTRPGLALQIRQAISTLESAMKQD